jgi:hypothetical protein
MIGLDPSQILEGGFNPEIAMSARSFDGPLARSPAGSTKAIQSRRGSLKILTPITGAASARHVAEVAKSSPAPPVRSSSEDNNSRRLALAGRQVKAAL